MTFAEQVIRFNKNLELDISLPKNIKVLHPFKENPQVLPIAEAFYGKFYNDNRERKMVLGINPGRLGAGSTGIPFTDPKRLSEKCGLEIDLHLHEPSSVFVYEVIDAYGSVTDFYSNVYIGSVCPLGFVIEDQKGKVKNYNYYDSASLAKKTTPFIVDSIKKQLEFGIDRQTGYCMGTGKNFAFLKKLNEEHRFFEELIPLEHPRYVMQYKAKTKSLYIDKYIKALKS
ncbi:DUF4918 family protein [Leptobacterium flavescens]|uniref:DUF4918 family protein n=1 Tax=Leptobacterium flavescens TaxID=472055 RepID=A0A6P0UII1_9FLAO|nr:uracil-DNA glycosylase family protein [Leptobacterium flavescens]NER13054.1 DUF4918 family protein [Leptobacterium flavescens]